MIEQAKTTDAQTNLGKELTEADWTARAVKQAIEEVAAAAAAAASAAAAAGADGGS